MFRNRRGGCCLIDTPPVARRTRVHALLAGLSLGLLALPVPAAAQPHELNATVVWVREGSVYIASPDSGVLAPPALLTLAYRGKPIATAEVVRVLDRQLVLARLTSGSLARVNQPGRLRVLGESPRLPALPSLRVGYPAPRRPNLLFACDDLALDPARLPHGYRTDQVARRSFRLVRSSENSTTAPWPDTLLLRLFDEPADEEIALERGELDAAVFGPGELSAHMREAPRWQEPLFGIRDRIALVAIAPGSAAAGDSSAAFDSLAFAALNRELFRGDLAPWPAGPDAPAGRRQPGVVRYVVDPSCPGQRSLESVLNRGLKLPAAGSGVSTVRVACLDTATAVPDSARARVLLLIRSPLVCGRALRPYLMTLGADVLVNLLACSPEGGEP